MTKEKKLENYLESKNRIYDNDSILYQGIRNTKMLDGTYKKLHLVNFTVSISNQQFDSNIGYFATFDINTEELFEIIGPQSYEKIG